jgi:phage-related minor tail protein
MADNEKIGGVNIEISGDFSKLDSDFTAAVGKAQQQGSMLASAIESSVKAPDTSGLMAAFQGITTGGQNAQSSLTGLASSLTGIGEESIAVGASIATGIVASFVALGAAAFEAADQMDKAFDHIRAATGKTGSDLTGLQESFRTVFANVPESAKNVRHALALIEQRTGLMGGEL